MTQKAGGRKLWVGSFKCLRQPIKLSVNSIHLISCGSKGEIKASRRMKTELLVQVSYQPSLLFVISCYCRHGHQIVGLVIET
jgi:hypothetical protein